MTNLCSGDRRSFSRSPKLVFFIVVASIILAETLAMFLLPLIGGKALWFRLLIDNAILMTLATPALYFFMYRPLAKGVEARAVAAEALRRSNEILDAINALQTRFIERYSDVGVCEKMLEGVAGLTGSPEGYFFEVTHTAPGGPHLRLVAATAKSHIGETIALAVPGTSPTALISHGQDSVLAGVINGGESVISNLPLPELRALPLPEGHLPVESFMAIPLFDCDKLAGIFLVANRPGGYRGEMAAELYPYLLTISKVLRAQMREREKLAAEAALRAARDEAQKAVELKNKFVSLVAHDLNQPLASIILSLGYLERVKEAREGAQGVHIVGQMKKTAEGMQHMISELLDLSRLQSGNLVPRPVRVDISSLATMAIGMSIRSAHKKGIELMNEIPHGTWVHADPDLMGEVLHNLITNAVKFTRPGGTVGVVVPDCRSGVVAVRDDGVGILPSMLPNIFSNEVKTSTPGTQGEKGTGLGLPLCKDIMLAHGGDLRVESERGKGTICYLTLPPLPSEASAPASNTVA